MKPVLEPGPSPLRLRKTEAELRNRRAEEQQYLQILGRASNVKDVLEVSAKLADVRARIDKLQDHLTSLHGQIEMAVLTANITALADLRVFGIDWRPLYKSKLALHEALSGLAAFGDFLVSLVVEIPVLAMWTFAIVALCKCGWVILRRIVLLFFPGLGIWWQRRAQAG